MKTPRWGRSDSRWIAFSLGLLLFGGILGFLLSSERADTLKQEGVFLETLSLVVERNISSQLSHVNQGLAGLALGSNDRIEDLTQVATALSGISKLLLIDSRGRVRLSTANDDAGVELSLEDDFLAARALPNFSGLIVSPPHTLGSERATWHVGRVILGPKGEFRGMARAVLDIAYYRSLMDSIRYVPEVGVSLFHEAGGTYLSLPEDTSVSAAKPDRAPTELDLFLKKGISAQLIDDVHGGGQWASVYRRLKPADVSLSSALVVEVSRDLRPVLERLSQTEALSWLVYGVAALTLGILLFFLRLREQRFSNQVVQYSDLIQNSSLRFQLATEAAHLGVWEWDPNTDVLNWDDQMSRLYGRESTEPTPTLRQWFDLVVPEDRVQAEEMLRQALKLRHSCHRMFRITRSDGTVRWIQCNSRYYGGEGGTPVRFIGINEDITQRVQSATSLMDRERFLKLVTESTHSMIAYFSVDEVCRFSNSSYAERHGFMAEELVGMTLRGVLGAELYQERREVIDQVLSGRPQEFQTPALDSEGVESFLWIHYVPDLSSGLVQGFFIVVDDITELKRARDQIEAQQGKLIFGARMAQMGELLNLISHQWRQPLTVISALVGNIQLKSQLGKLDTDYLMPKLDKITQTVQAMSSTIESFRTFFSPSTAPGRTDLVDMTLKALDILSPVLQRSGHEVKLNAPSHALWAHVRQSELMQVVIEVLGNARQALSGLGSPGWIQLEWQEQGRTAILTISNNGGAIPASVLPRIFEPYFSTKSDGSGTGMGLYMAKVIVESHHQGTLEATCEGDVTSFRISLPLEETSP